MKQITRQAHHNIFNAGNAGVNSFSLHDSVFVVSAVLSVTGTISNCTTNFGTVFGADKALWHMIAAKFPPAEDPPIATFWRLRERSLEAVEWSHKRDSQESWTAAG